MNLLATNSLKDTRGGTLRPVVSILVRATPWFALVAFPLALYSDSPAGYGAGMVTYMVALGLAVTIVRWRIRRVDGRGARLGLDLLVLAIAYLLAPLYGVWLIPGLVGFAALDAVDLGSEEAFERGVLLLALLGGLALLPGYSFGLFVWPGLFIAGLAAVASIAGRRRAP